jgi:hypothetical protein
MITYPNIGIIDFIEKDINNPDLAEIHKDPKVLFEIMEKDTDNAMFKLYNDERKRMSTVINNLQKDFVKLLDVENPKIHWLEYKENFHQLFVDENLDEDSKLERTRAWLTVTRSPSAKVDIVNSEGELMFTHPGLMGNVDHTMGKDNWNKFKAYSEANKKMGGTFKQEFQKNHINNFLAANDKYKESYNSTALTELLRINAFFESIDDEGNPLEDSEESDVENQLNVEEPTTVERLQTKSDDIDLDLYD